jgi:hypothetical protein
VGLYGLLLRVGCLGTLTTDKVDHFFLVHMYVCCVQLFAFLLLLQLYTQVYVPVLHVPVVQLHVPYTVTYLFPMCTVVPHDDDIHTHAYMLTYM